MLNKFLSTELNNNQISWAALLLRLVGGGFMLTHGIPKLMKVLAGNFQFGDPLGIGVEASLILTVFAEFLCALCVLLGLGTRMATLPLIITMAVAAFLVHGSDPFGKKELALIYLAIYAVLFFLGSGKYSLDALLGRSKAVPI